MASVEQPSGRASDAAHLFAAEAAYADSIFRSVLRDGSGCVDALRRSLEYAPAYAPAILALGSVEYQLGHRIKGRRLLFSLLDLPDNTEDLFEIIDKAGDFLIQSHRYSEGLAFYRQAAARYPKVAVFHQGVGCCAGHKGVHEEAIRASRAALAIEPDNQRLVNDLGWSLCEAGRLDEAFTVLKNAVSMDKKNALAAENLKVCASHMKARTSRRRK
ncbi:MAG: tetratricopeptide repeat protein [Elusimicrobiales bacterium]|jgi:tetratricopeptide (TPR) repeat protein